VPLVDDGERAVGARAVELDRRRHVPSLFESGTVAHTSPGRPPPPVKPQRIASVTYPVTPRI
jgi:hypothetical protein